jgi:predicted KAP-like P-loop ATPase
MMVRYWAGQAPDHIEVKSLGEWGSAQSRLVMTLFKLR